MMQFCAHAALRRLVRLALSVAPAVALVGGYGCAVDPDTVELRMFPCLVDGAHPLAVRVEIQPYDDAGVPVGKPLSGGYSIPDGAFDDGFATLGYRPGPRVVTADFSVLWYAAVMPGPEDDPDAIVTHLGIAVPDLGDVVELTGAGCDGGAESGDETSAGTTGADSTTDDSDSATSGTGSEATSSDTSSDTGSGSTTDPSSSTTESDTGTTGGDTLEGESCEMPFDFYCEPLESGGGKLLECLGDIWTDSEDGCGTICGEIGGVPNPIGCAGEAASWVCLCQAVQPQSCMAEPPGCSQSGEFLTLCADGEAATARCPNLNCNYVNAMSYQCS